MFRREWPDTSWWPLGIVHRIVLAHGVGTPLAVVLQGGQRYTFADIVLSAACPVQVLAGQYAFVLHTASPFSGERGEMYGELVCGLGETLVGNHPGRPLAFSDRPGLVRGCVRLKGVCEGQNAG